MRTVIIQGRRTVKLARSRARSSRLRGGRLLAITIMVCVMVGCASHRGRPPVCRGPYTPINHSLVASSNDPQR